MQKIPDDAVEALDLLVNDPGVFFFGRTPDESPLQAVQADIDGRERISDFMRHPGGQRPQRGQFFLSIDDGAAFDELRAERSNPHAVNQARGGESRDQHKCHQAARRRCKPPRARCELPTNPSDATCSAAFSFATRSRIWLLFPTPSRSFLSE